MDSLVKENVFGRRGRNPGQTIQDVYKKTKSMNNRGKQRNPGQRHKIFLTELKKKISHNLKKEVPIRVQETYRIPSIHWTRREIPHNA